MLYDSVYKKGIKIPVEWNEKWFGRKSSYEYDHDIAKFSSFLSAAAYADVVADGDNNFLLTDYRLLGIRSDDVEMHYDVNYDDSILGNDQVAYSIASKVIDSSKGKQTLVLVSVRGTPMTANEWLSNLNITTQANSENMVHNGFGKAANAVYMSLISYLLRHKIDPTDSFILVTGHSRGAAVSNLLGKVLCDDKFFKAENCYIYTFASPNVTTSEYAHDAKYDLIYNIVNAEDVVPTVPLFRGNWRFRKYGKTLALANYTNSDQEYYDNVIIPEINRWYNEFFGRNYCAFYTGPYVPILITRMLTRYVGSVEKFYSGIMGMHDKIEHLTDKMFRKGESEGKEKKNSFMDSIIKNVNKKHEGYIEYISFAFQDMHLIETYMSFMLNIEQEKLYSDMGYTLIVLDGPIEASVVDFDDNIFLRVIEGIVKLENQFMPVVAAPGVDKKVLIGTPANMDFKMFVTDDAIIPTSAKINLEHFNSAGVYLGSSPVQKLYVTRYRACTFNIGNAICGKNYVEPKLVRFRERQEHMKYADLYPEYKYRIYPEFHVSSNAEISGGVHFGIPVLYGTLLFSHDVSNYRKGVDFLGGAGTHFQLCDRFCFDGELLAKLCVFTKEAETSRSAALVPQLRITLSRDLIGTSKFFIGCALDFNIDGMNDCAFEENARRHNFFNADVDPKFGVSPSIQIGFRF